MGVCGTCSFGSGVYGYSDWGAGVKGISNKGHGTQAAGVKGVAQGSDGRGVHGYATGSNGTGVYGDGTKYDFYAGGLGSNYAPFTGAHEAKLANNFPQAVKAGMIVSVTGQSQVRRDQDGAITISSTLPTVNLSEEPNDKGVLGAFGAEVTLPEDHWYQPKEAQRFAMVNGLGEGRVWVSDISGAIQTGDYITTSSIPGYGQRQDDDLLHSYTLGKVIEQVDWDSVEETVEFDGQTHKIYLIAVVYTSG